MKAIKYLTNLFGRFPSVKRIHRYRLRKILRGSQEMKKSGDPFVINRINEEFTSKNLKINVAHVSKCIFGEDKQNIEIIVRQFLLARLEKLQLNKAILSAFESKKKRIIYKLPDEWIFLLEANNLQVDRFKSRILFKIYILMFFLYGTISIFSIIIDFFKQNKLKKINVNRKFVNFVDLKPHSLPRQSTVESYDLINWYLNWEGRIQGLNEIHHNIKLPSRMYRNMLLLNSHFIPPIYDLKNQLKYLMWGLTSIIISFISFFRGRWVNCLLLREAALAKRIILADHKLIAAEYFFSNSGSTYRPLWTYPAERRGSVITMYYYSVNYSHFLTARGYPNIQLGFQSMNWPRILNWSKPFAEYTQTLLLDKNVKITLVPPIYYCDFDILVPQSDKPYIAVFDIIPARESFYTVFNIECDYYNFLNCKNFLEDIYDTVVSSGYNLMWKRKRSYGNNSFYNSAYIKFADSFFSRQGIICPHPDVSAFRVIKNSYAAVSIPFTSTAIIASHFLKPSVYYDSTNILFKDDRGAQSIPLISGKSELVEWIKSIDKDR